MDAEITILEIESTAATRLSPDAEVEETCKTETDTELHRDASSSHSNNESVSLSASELLYERQQNRKSPESQEIQNLSIQQQQQQEPHQYKNKRKNFNPRCSAIIDNEKISTARKSLCNVFVNIGHNINSSCSTTNSEHFHKDKQMNVSEYKSSNDNTLVVLPREQIQTETSPKTTPTLNYDIPSISYTRNRINNYEPLVLTENMSNSVSLPTMETNPHNSQLEIFSKLHNTEMNLSHHSMSQETGGGIKIDSDIQSMTNQIDPEVRFREFAIKTMQELLNIYGLSISPTDIIEALKKQQQQQQQKQNGM